VEVYTTICDGFYARSLSEIRVEGEVGNSMTVGATNPTPVPQSSSSSAFPGYSGRGYAVFNVSETERVMGQWIIPSLPRAGDYQLLLLYSNPVRKSRRLDASVNQNNNDVEDLFVDIGASCISCIAPLSANPRAPITHNFTLTSDDMLTLNLVFTTIQVLLDAIIAVPQEFAGLGAFDGDLSARDTFM